MLCKDKRVTCKDVSRTERRNILHKCTFTPICWRNIARFSKRQNVLCQKAANGLKYYLAGWLTGARAWRTLSTMPVHNSGEHPLPLQLNQIIAGGKLW